MRAVRISLVVAIVLFLPLPAAAGEASADSAYEEAFYPSGNLRIQAYLYKPSGDGPFPVVIYNHGTRDGRERASVPFEYVGRMLTRAGYMVLVPERRGYGKSDGAEWRQEAGRDRSALIRRLEAETQDVLAGIDYLRTVPSADTHRMAIMGWSFGGIVTMLAVSHSKAFLAAVDQAGGALTWDSSPELRRALVEAAEKASTPTLFMVAKNDRTTSSVTTLDEIYRNRGVPERLVVYDAFTPARETRIATPGHAVFSEQGAGVWESDVVQFLGRYLKN